MVAFSAKSWGKTDILSIQITWAFFEDSPKNTKKSGCVFFDHLKYNKDPFLFHDFIAFPHFSVLTFFFDKSSMTIKLNLP